MSKRKYLRSNQFHPHPDDADGVERLSSIRFGSFGLTPRGRVYGFYGCLADSDVDALLQLPRLIELTVSNFNQIQAFTDGGMEQLLAHSSLKIFGCAQNAALTDRSAAALSASSQMRWFCLNGCSITDTGVQHLSIHRQLFGLYLADTQITDDCVEYLCRLTELRRLTLRGTLISKSSRARMLEHMPNCRSVLLGDEGGCQPRNESAG